MKVVVKRVEYIVDSFAALRTRGEKGGGGTFANAQSTAKMEN